MRSVAMRLRVPEVVVLAHYDGLPGATVPFSRRNIYRRDRYTCQYCGSQPAMEELTIDHVRPRSRRRLDVGELRTGLFRMQSPQGGPHAGTGPDAFASCSAATRLASALFLARQTDQELGTLPGRSLLERNVGE